MNASDTGTIVTSTISIDTPLSARERAETRARKRRPIDLRDMPEVDIDDTWVMPGVGNVLGLHATAPQDDGRVAA